MARPVILFDAWPRTPQLVCDPPTLARLEALGELVLNPDGPMPAETIERYLPEVEVVMGEIDLPAERLDRAPKLRAIFNISGNFGANVDYEACQRRGIHVMTGGPAFAVPVAESAFAMAIDLVRDITRHDREFRAGTEKWFHFGTGHTTLFTGQPVGIIGYGDLGRALRRMLVPFNNPVKVYDPWLSDYAILKDQCAPATLEDVLSTSRVIFVFASPTVENRHFIGREQFDLIQPGSAFVLMSRAGVVDFPELVRQVEAGRFTAAVDVFPQEPVAADDPVRRLDGMLLSGHRTGGMQEAFHEIGRLVVSDAELVLRGLPPVSCRRAHFQIAARFDDRTVRPGMSREKAVLPQYQAGRSSSRQTG